MRGSLHRPRVQWLIRVQVESRRAKSTAAVLTVEVHRPFSSTGMGSKEVHVRVPDHTGTRVGKEGTSLACNSALDAQLLQCVASRNSVKESRGMNIFTMKA